MSTAEPGPQRPALLTEAAAAVSRDRRTVRRQLDAGRYPNAYRGSDGQWRIPITDLAAAGFRVNAPSGPEWAPPAPDVEALAQLRTENAVLRERIAAAEALATERERELVRSDKQLGALRQAIAALTSSEPPRAPEPEPPVLDVELVPEPADVEPEPKRRRRWRRAR